MDPTPDALCPGCFTDPGGTHPCPHCGYDERAARSPLLLPQRTLLQGQFLVGRVLGRPGGFGITYLGWDRRLERRVAIKEFLPRDLAGRGADQVTVVPHSPEDREVFDYGLEQFLREARTLAKLDHPNIVRVMQVFEANDTAYLIMECYAGLTLADYLDRKGGRLPESEALALMQPVLDGLRVVHTMGLLHRHIKPQNIYLARLDGGGVRPILLDFVGAARQVMSERTRSLSAVLTECYAAFEQYTRRVRQGPWTDVYAVAAVLYRMVTGLTPPSANSRMAEDDLAPAATHGASAALSRTLTAALALAPEARLQDIPALQAALWPLAEIQPRDAGVRRAGNWLLDLLRIGQDRRLPMDDLVGRTSNAQSTAAAPPWQDGPGTGVMMSDHQPGEGCPPGVGCADNELDSIRPRSDSMGLITCGKGHFYDRGTYADCPYCALPTFDSLADGDEQTARSGATPGLSIQRCPLCFQPIAGQRCLHCGWPQEVQRHPSSLAIGSLLSGSYRIGQVLHHGGFGFLYLAWDENLDLPVTIREYLPRDQGVRRHDADGRLVVLPVDGAADWFNDGFRRFIDEARILARMDVHPVIVGLKQLFRTNGTAYTVMEYLDGISLWGRLGGHQGQCLAFGEVSPC